MLAILVLALYGLFQVDAGPVTTPAPALSEDPEGLFQLLFKAAKDQQPGWQVAILVVVGILLVFGLRKFSGWLSTKVKAFAFLKWFTGDAGGYTLSIATATLEVFLAAVAAGQPVTGSLVWSGIRHAALMALAFMGGKKTGLIKSNPKAP